MAKHPRWIMSLEVEVVFTAANAEAADERAAVIAANAEMLVGQRAPAAGSGRPPGSARVFRVGFNQEPGAIMRLEENDG